MLAKAITRSIIVNSIAFSSFSSVFFFQNAKLDFAMTLKKAKIRENYYPRNIKNPKIREN